MWRKSVWLKGNQVQILSDPVTVSGEAGCRYAIVLIQHEKAQPLPMIRKSGNLLEFMCIASEESNCSGVSAPGSIIWACFFGRKGRPFLLPVL